MKKIFKRFISGLSAAAVLASVVPVQTVFADDEISSVTLAIVDGTQPKKGWSAKDTNIQLSVPSEADYEVETVSLVELGEIYQDMSEDSIIGDHVYLAVGLKAADGMAFGMDDITLDGIPAESSYSNGNDLTAYFKVDSLPTFKVQAVDGIVYADGWSQRQDYAYQVAGGNVTIEFPDDDTKEFIGWAYYDPINREWTAATKDKVLIENFLESRTSITVVDKDLKLRAGYTNVEPPAPDAVPIEKVEVEFVTPTNGDRIDDPDISVPENAPYYIEKALFTRSETELTPAEGYFEYGTYYMGLLVKVREGYMFTEDTVISVSGVKAAVINDDPTPSTMQIAARFITKGKPVNEVNVTAEIPSAGTDSSDGVVVEVPEGAPYTVTGTTILDKDLNTFTGTFAEGEDYYISAELKTNSGYAFHNELTSKFNGEPWTINCSVKEKTFSAYYHFVCSSEPVVLTNIEDTSLLFELPGKGAKGTDVPDVNIPENKGYTLTETAFLKKSTGRTFTGLLENRSDYYVQVVLSKEEGYEFDESVPVTLNGAEPDMLIFTPTKITAAFIFHFEYDDRQLINNAAVYIEIPEVDTSCAQRANIMIPYDANYELSDSCFKSDTDTVMDKFLKNKVYYAEIVLKAKDGYKFDEAAVVNINGKEAEGHIDEDDAGIYIADLYFIPVYIEPVTKVQHLSFTVPEVGTSGNSQPVINVIDPVGFTLVDAYYAENGEPFTGEFEVEKEYQLIVKLKASEGYMFTDETEVLFDKVYSYFNNSDISVYGRNIEADKDHIVSVCMFRPEVVTNITSVDITFDVPETGTPVNEIPVVNFSTSPDGAAEMYNAVICSDGTSDGNFLEYGRTYTLNVYFEKNNAFRITRETRFTVNGKELAKVPSETGIEEIYSVYETDMNRYRLEYDFTPKINEISEIDLEWTKPEAGTSPVSPTADVRMPAFANISDSKASYSDYMVTDNVNMTEAFENGRTYYLNVTLSLIDGYKFSKNPCITVGGLRPAYVVMKSDRSYTAAYLFSCDDITPNWLDKAEIDFEKPRIGTDIGDINSYISKNTEGFRILAVDVYRAEDESFENFTSLNDGDTVENGKNYKVRVQIAPTGRNLFGRDMKLYVNSEESTESEKSVANSFDALAEGYDPVYSVFYISFVGTPEDINEVSASVELPEAGDSASEKPKVTLANSADYKVASAVYLDSTMIEYTDEFDNDENYFVRVVLKPSDNYQFNKNTVINVNGEAPYKKEIKNDSLTFVIKFRTSKEKNEKKIIYIDTDPGFDDLLVELMPVEEGKFKLPDCSFKNPNGQVFVGWEVNGKMYAEGDEIELHNNTTIHAVWKDKPFAYEYGDVDLSGSIDIEDAVKLINYINGQSPLDVDSLKAADCNRDGDVDIEDAVMIINQINGVSIIPQDK